MSWGLHNLRIRTLATISHNIINIIMVRLIFHRTHTLLMDNLSGTIEKIDM